MLLTTPDEARGDEFSDVTPSSPNSLSSSFLQQNESDEEGSPQRPYQTAIQPSEQPDRSAVRLLPALRLEEQKSVESDRGTPKTCRNSAVNKEFSSERTAMTQRRPHVSSNRLIRVRERGSPNSKRVVFRVGGSAKPDPLTRSLLGQVLGRCLVRSRQSNKSFRYVVSIKKCGLPHSPENLSAGEQSMANKSTSMSKEERGAPLGGGTLFPGGREVTIEQSVINESAEETMLHDYWTRKDEIEEKYGRMERGIDKEEMVEINLKLTRGTSGLDILKEISALREYYANVKTLITQQKLIELQDVLNDFQKRIAVRS